MGPLQIRHAPIDREVRRGGRKQAFPSLLHMLASVFDRNVCIGKLSIDFVVGSPGLGKYVSHDDLVAE